VIETEIDGIDWDPVFAGDLSDQKFELNSKAAENVFEMLIPSIFDGDDDF
jgi:hypothetical protein